MAFGSVTLIPGVNVERTPTLLRTGVSSSRLIRYKDGLVQKYGGWTKYFSTALGGVPRDLHAWKDLQNTDRLAVATTTQVDVITGSTLQNVTPQKLVSSFTPSISTVASSADVEIDDPNISDVTVYDAVFFDTPVSHGGLILDGLYQITQVTGTSSYKITAPTAATATEGNPNATNGTTAAGNATLHFATTPAWVVAGMVVGNVTDPDSIPASTVVVSVTGTTVVMSNNAAGAGVGSGDLITFTSIPVFETLLDSSIVQVTFIDHGLAVGDRVNFAVSTTGGGVTIFGAYTVATVSNADKFTIAANTAATSTAVFAMNGGELQLTYLIALGPPPLGAGYGLGGYGEGGFGTGVLYPAQTGVDYAASDWTLANWGELLVSCPQNGPIFYWSPSGGFTNSSVISQAPPVNSGVFISMSEQILVAYGSSVHLDIGYQQQPLLVQWCTVGDLFNWEVSSATQAGNFTIPLGSLIVGGMAVTNQNLLWTDTDLWAMSYIGPPFVYSFNKIGAGAGLVSSQAAQQLRGSVYWMGRSNFYAYTSGGVSVLPCPVWDAVFQNLNTDYLQNIRAMPNTPFNEVGWLYPSAASTNGECDSYVKMNITEQGAPWDYGPLARSAWLDQSALGPPIGATPSGVVYQQEDGFDADGQPITASFTTGFFYLAEGEEFAVVDQVLPDFKWGNFSNTSAPASIQITFNVTNYPGDTPISYGPYTVTQATQYISTRFRGRLMSITVSSEDLGSFWRLGSIKYRYAPAGRR